MSHINLIVYNDNCKPHFGIAGAKLESVIMAEEMDSFSNTLIDAADGDLSDLMSMMLEVSDRHISFQAKHDDRDITCHKFVLASHCKDPYLNGLLARYLEKVAEFEKNQ